MSSACAESTQKQAEKPAEKCYIILSRIEDDVGIEGTATSLDDAKEIMQEVLECYRRCPPMTGNVFIKEGPTILHRVSAIPRGGTIIETEPIWDLAK